METTTYKKTNSPTAIYGENSAAVLKLQQELNAKGAGLTLDSKYGPLTQAAFTKFNNQTTPPAPTTTPNRPITTPSVTPDRLVRTANKNDSDISKLEKTLSNTYSSSAPDLAKITEQKRMASQALVDSVRAEFARVIDEQGVSNAKMNDRVRALNVGAGLGGSDFGTAAAIGQEKKGEKAVQLIEQERDAKIQAIYAGIDDRASAEYREQRKEYITGLENNLKAKKEARDQDRKKAEESIKGFASAGVDISKIKEADPDTFELLLEEYGGSEMDLETAWNAALPDNMKTKFEQKIIRGADGNAIVLRYGFNPITGKTESNEYDMGVEYSKIAGTKEAELKEIDGRLWSVTTDENGQQVAKPLTEVSELTRSMINENNASAAKSRADANGTGSNAGFKFSGTQRSKLVNKNFNDADINAIEKDLKAYGIEEVLKRLSAPDQAALRDAMAGSDLATQIAELMKVQ